MHNNKIVQISLLLFVSIAVGCMYLRQCQVKQEAIGDIIEYLRAAANIKIIKNEYFPESQKVISTTICESGITGVADFVSVLENSVTASDTNVEVDKYYTFSGSYCVYLSCQKIAVIDFILNGDNNIACLNNNDYYLFTRFSDENACKIKQYFTKLNVPERTNIR